MDIDDDEGLASLAGGPGRHRSASPEASSSPDSAKDATPGTHDPNKPSKRLPVLDDLEELDLSDDPATPQAAQTVENETSADAVGVEEDDL